MTNFTPIATVVAAPVMPEWLSWLAAFFIVIFVIILFKLWINTILVALKDVSKDLIEFKKEMSDDFHGLKDDMLSNYTKTSSFVTEKEHTNQSRKELWIKIDKIKETNTEKIHELDTAIKLGFQELNLKINGKTT